MSEIAPALPPYRDRSSLAGYQFEVLCPRCGQGTTSTLMPAASLAARAGTMLAGQALEHVPVVGGALGNVVGGMLDDRLKEAALQEAAAEVGGQFAICRSCGQWRCGARCWNHTAGLCLDCAPVPGVGWLPPGATPGSFTTPPQRVAIAFSPFKLIRGFFAGIALTVLFVLIIQYHAVWKVQDWVYWIAFPGVPIAAVATLYWAYRLFRRRPALLITPEGVSDQSSATGLGLIRWEEIQAIGLREAKSSGANTHYLTIRPQSMAAIRQRQRSALTKAYTWADAEISLDQTMLPIKVEQLLDLIDGYYRAYVATRLPHPIIFSRAMVTEAQT